MPAQDATRLLTEVSDHPVFAHRLRRWTHPEAWMNVVYIFPSDEGADLANAAQLHFPRVQLPELVAALGTA
jgi:hypothetical protein